MSHFTTTRAWRGARIGLDPLTITAKFENGVFRPREDVKIKEGTLVEVVIPVEQKAPDKRPSIKDLPFYGIWKDRADIGDGVDYVNDFRENPRG